MFFGLNDVAFLGSLQPPTPLLLDLYPNAAAAYSLRQLRIGVTNVVRVRRSSDNTEADFTAAQISDGSLAAWVGAGNNGFVRTWYDQSGNGRHATQATNARQPQLCDSTGIILDRTKPTISFGGSQFLPHPSSTSLLTDSQNAVSIYVAKGTGGFSGDYSGGASSRWYYPLVSGTNYTAGYGNAGEIGSTTEDGNSHLFTLIASSSAGVVQVRRDSSQVFSGGLQAFNVSSGPFGIGRAAGLNPPNGCWIGVITEHIFYSSDQYVNLAGIEANINAHYSIY
jgi:hypothetical protein